MKDKVSSLKNLIRKITLIWAYFTVLSLFAFGVSLLQGGETFKLIFAIVVFPVPLVPQKRYACPTLPDFIWFFKVVFIYTAFSKPVHRSH